MNEHWETRVGYLIDKIRKLEQENGQHHNELRRCFDFIRTLQGALESAERNEKIKMYEHLYRSKDQKWQDAENTTKQSMQEDNP